jgi:hypothetical protein
LVNQAQKGEWLGVMLINNKKIVFAINSNRNFYLLSLPKALRSLLDAGVDEDSIMVIVGGFDDEFEGKAMAEELKDYWKINKIHTTKQNSCDYTTFNFLADYPDKFSQFDYLFYMHDTSWVGNDFLNRLKEHTPHEQVDSYGLTGSWSMNIGLYNIDYLLSKEEEIRKALNTDNSPDVINIWKQWGATTEDYLMNKADGCYTNANALESLKLENPYGSDIKRRTRYFHCLDFYKSQSNWNGVQPEMNKSL